MPLRLIKSLNLASDQRLCYSGFFWGVIISKHGTGEISIIYLVSVAEDTDLNIASSEFLKTGFVASLPIMYFMTICIFA